MKKKSPLFAIAAMLLFIFAACLEPPEASPTASENNDTKKIEITNIPLVNAHGTALYKVYLQLSVGMDEAAGHVAEAEALLNGNTSIILNLTCPDDQKKPWSGTGRINLAVTVAPKTVSGSGDILAHGGTANMKTEIHSLNWDNQIDINTFMPMQLESLFEGVVRGDPAIKWEP